MKKFEVHFTGFMSIEADSLQEANEKTTNLKVPDTNITTTLFIDEENGAVYEVIGHCEVSGKAIFEGDEYSYDPEDGIYVLNEYLGEEPKQPEAIWTCPNCKNKFPEIDVKYKCPECGWISRDV